MGKWCDIARKYRFDNAEFYDLVRALDRKVLTNIKCYTTETKTVNDGAKEDDAELRRCYDAQWESSDSFLKVLKQRRRHMPLRKLQKFDAFEEEDKYIDPTLVG